VYWAEGGQVVALAGLNCDIGAVKRSLIPSSADLIFMVVVPVASVIGTVKLTQSDGDLAAHIRMGETILSAGQLPTHSLASYTAASDPLVAHAWLSEVVFALLFRLGGLPLLTIITTIVIALTHGAIAVWLRKRGADPRWAFAAAMLSLALASTHWLTRPHMFSIVGAALTLMILELESARKKMALSVVLFAVWANLHGGWLFGEIMIAAYIAGDILEARSAGSDGDMWRSRARANAAMLALSLCATLINPYGIGLHREVFSAVTSTSLATNISEYLPPNFTEILQVPFIIAILLTITLFTFTTKRIQYDWLVLILISLFFALRSYRNIALFGVTAWPLIALYAARAWPERTKPFRWFSDFARLDQRSRTGIIAVPLGIIALAVGLNHGSLGGVQLVPDHFSSRKFPVAAVAKAREARLQGNVFDAWVWGGYIMYAWPEARLHVDPLKFNDTTIKSYTTIETRRPGWEREIQRWQIRTIIVGSKSPMAAGLASEPQWQVWYQDSIATVFRPSSSGGI
jgi:hypothetical protein